MELNFTKIINSNTFYQEVEALVIKYDLRYMEAIVYYCERNNIEIETIASLVKSNQRIKAIIQSEGEDLNFLPRTAKLPI